MLALSFVFSSVRVSSAYAGDGERTFVAQFREDAARDIRFATHVEPVFPGTQDAALKNIFRFRSNKSLEALRSSLGENVSYLGYDGEITAADLIVTPVKVYNDPWYTTSSLDINRQWYLAKAKFIDAWEKISAKSSVVVAVLDTGIDSTHEDLKDITYATGYDFLNKSEIAPGTSKDVNGHGTLITGVLAATGGNGVGIVGAASGVSIMPLVALDKEGIGQSSVIAEAIVWAADHGAHIINLSLSDTGTGHDVTLANAISYAFNKGVLLVAAGGNDSVATGVNLDTSPLFPICDDNGQNMVLGVAATDYRDSKPDFSNYGKSCIDVSAPGKRIVSTVNVDPYNNQPAANSYAYASGTSLAVPLVVAQAALIKTLYPYATNKQIRDTIIATSDSIDGVNLNCGSASCTGLLGAGRINVLNSLEKNILNERVKEGSLVQTPSGAVYYMSGGKRQPVSLFVKEQRFKQIAPAAVEESEIAQFPLGAYAEALEGTLFKLPNSPTVFYMGRGIKYPVTGQVFALRMLSFASVQVLSPEEAQSWVTGPFLPPPDGMLVKTAQNPTVYWIIGSSLHPVNYEYYMRRGLSALPITVIPDADLKSFPVGEAYIL